MATGTITSVTIRADGWSADVVVEGFTTGATYDFGSFDDSPATISDPKMVFTVVSEGYSSSGVLGTVTRTVYGTKVVRKPYPDEADNDETGGGNLSVRVALSSSIYDDDNTGAGNSGTAPTVTISAGWCTNTGGSSQTSLSATNLTCTNNSTLDYPVIVSQWAWGHTPAFLRVESNTIIGVCAYHGHGIACVTLSAVGATSANSASGTVTSKTAHQMSPSNLYYESYDLSVPVAGYTQGEKINLNFIAYPLVGDEATVVDTSAQTDLFYAVNGNAQITCNCDKTGELKDYAIVSTAGDDSTGAKSTVLATAEGLPYLTIGKALESGATVIYCRTGTYDLVGSTPVSVTARDYYIEVLPYPNEAVTLNRGGTFRTPKASKLSYSGFTITCDSANGYISGTAVQFRRFHNNTLTISVTPTGAGLSYQAYGTYFLNCTLDGDEHFTQINGGAMYNLVGNVFSDKVSNATVWRTVVANKLAGDSTTGVQFQVLTATSTQDPTNLIFSNNSLTGCYQASAVQLKINYASVPCVVIGNVLEISDNSGTGKNCEIYADGSILASDSVIVAHNTFVGFRTNLFYNDIGTSAILRTNSFVRNNAFSCYNIKTDLYGTPDGARVGNWSCIYGVNYSDNIYDMTSSASFTNEFDGINTRFYTAKVVENDSTDLGFSDDACGWGDGSGNGNYLPAEGSVLKDHTLYFKYQSYDLFGTAL